MNEDLDILWRAADSRVQAPLGFEDRLYARLERERPFVVPVPVPETMPWWVRLAGERHVAFAFVLAGILLASPAFWLSTAGPARAAIAAFGRSAEAGLAPWIAPLFSTPNAALAIALALTPWLAWGSYRLLFAIERRTARLALTRR